MQKQAKTAPTLFQRGVEYGKRASPVMLIFTVQGLPLPLGVRKSQFPYRLLQDNYDN